MHYFGPWDDHDCALKKHLQQKDDLPAGRKMRAEAEARTVKGLANAFLDHKQALRPALQWKRSHACERPLSPGGAAPAPQLSTRLRRPIPTEQQRGHAPGHPAHPSRDANGCSTAIVATLAPGD
jgi:hypothetical protein